MIAVVCGRLNNALAAWLAPARAATWECCCGRQSREFLPCCSLIGTARFRLGGGLCQQVLLDSVAGQYGGVERESGGMLLGLAVLCLGVD